MTLDQVTRADFAQYLGQPFRIECGGRAVEAELANVTGLGFNSPAEAPRDQRESFSLLFRAPKQWRYPQSIYRLSHARLGTLDVFLVPLGPDEHGMRLEAVFNFA